MALNPQSLTDLVTIDHLALFPASAASVRQNAATGVLPHNPAFAFIEGLCTGVATALLTLTIMDLGTGTADVPGNSPAVPVVFPGIPVAQAYLVTRMAWSGPASGLAAQIFVGSVLLNVSKLALLKMNPNPLMGTGTGIVSPASNPALETAALAALNAALPVAFQATGKFGTGDVPGAPVNPILLAQLPGYAEALAKGIATMTATVPYVGVSTPTTPVAGIVNTGRLF